MSKNTDWQVISLRMTVFVSADEYYQSDSWWENVVGYVPDEKLEQQRQQKISYEGNFKEGKLSLEVYRSENRVNWLFKPNEPEFILAGQMPTLGSFVETINHFVKYMQKWLVQDIPALYRIAYGAIIVQPANTVEESYKLLSDYLNRDFDESTTSDLMYRINRRRTSDVVDNLSINRVTTWSSYDFLIELTHQFGHMNKLLKHHTCRLELDINNVPSKQKLDKSILPELFSEFVALGNEIAQQGDIK